MPTRRSNRLRTAPAGIASSATPDVTPIEDPVVAVAEDTAPVVTSRRARRLAAAGLPAVQPMAAPAEIIAEPASALPIDSVDVVAAPSASPRMVFDESALGDSARIAGAFGRGGAQVASAAAPALSESLVAPAAKDAVTANVARAERAAGTKITEPTPQVHPKSKVQSTSKVVPGVQVAAAFGRTVTAAPTSAASGAGRSAPRTSAPTTPISMPTSAGSGEHASDGDAFSLASEAFGFSVADDSTDLDDSTDIPVADEPVVDGVDTAHVAPRRPRRSVRRFAAAGASLGVMGVAGLIAVSMTLPVSAVAASQGVDPRTSASLVAPGSESTTKVADDEIQAFVASSDVEGSALTRSDEFSTVSISEVAAEEGIRFSESLYTNDPEAAIQWPFIVGVAMSSPYGQRWGRLHAGIDLVPGKGAPIQAIADGVVVKATEAGGAYGVNVYVEHVIDGQKVVSHYAHMLYGSLKVQTGQKVKVGDILGNVGNTGRSYGAHLHFEIIINGSTVDPLPWMRKNAGRYEY